MALQGSARLNGTIQLQDDRSSDVDRIENWDVMQRAFQVRCIFRKDAEYIFMEGVKIGRSVGQKETALMLRRIADAIEAGKSLNFQINGRRVYFAHDPLFKIQLSKRNSDEIDIKLRWDNNSGN